jgi:hypothetical protein
VTASEVTILPYAAPAARSTRYRLPAFWQFVLVGYLTFARGFAYLGIPPLFIGELFIARSFLGNYRRWIQRFVDEFFHGRLLALGVGLTLLWGMFELGRTFVTSKYPTMSAIKTFAFNYYPLCILIGRAYGQDMTVDRFIGFWKYVALFYAGYSIAYPILAPLDIKLPVTGVPIINVPALAGLMPAMLLALWPYFKGWKWRYPVLLLSFLPLMYYPSRGAIMGMVVGLLCVSLVSVQRVLTILGGAVGLLAVLMVVGPMISPLLGEDGPQVDPTVPIARLVALADQDVAVQMLRNAGYAHEAEEVAHVAAGTAGWRASIWGGAVDSLNTTELMLLGHGHGADLGAFMPHGEDIRTPHNYVIYLIFYTGAIGLALFHLLILGLITRGLAVPNRNFRATIVGITLLTCVMALVGNLFETPFAAIPFYLLCGVLIGLDYRGVSNPPPMMLVPVAAPEPSPAPVAPRVKVASR